MYLFASFPRTLVVAFGFILAFLISEVAARWFVQTAVADIEPAQPHQVILDLISLAGTYCLSTFKTYRISLVRLLKKPESKDS